MKIHKARNPLRNVKTMIFKIKFVLKWGTFIGLEVCLEKGEIRVVMEGLTSLAMFVGSWCTLSYLH